MWWSLPYCSRCGTELTAGIKFCTNCGASTSAPLPTVPPVQTKPSHTKRNLAIIVIFVILVGVVAAASSRGPSQSGTTQTTIGELPTGSTVTIGEPFIVKGTDDVPVQLNFTSAWFAMRYDDTGAVSPNKYFVLEFQMKNVGIRSTSVFSLAFLKWDALVDKGYIYESDNYADWNFSSGVGPAEVATNNVVFNILAATTPLEVRYYDTCAGSTADCSPTFTVNLRGITIPAKEELTVESSSSFCAFQNGTVNMLNVTNSGLAAVTIAEVYYADQIVNANPTQIRPGETVGIPITIPSNIQAGFAQQYEIKVVTTQGNTFTENCYYEGS